MSGRIVGEVLENAPEDLTLSELVVLLAIAEDARDKDRLARFSDLENLQRRTRIKPGTIRNALSQLTQRGLLAPQVAHVHRGGSHQEYVIPKLEGHHRGILKVNGTER